MTTLALVNTAIATVVALLLATIVSVTDVMFYLLYVSLYNDSVIS